MSERFLASGQLVATMFLVALVTVLAKLSLQSVEAIDFVWLQMVFAILSISFYSLVLKKERLPADIPLKAWLIVIAMGVCNFTLVRTFFILALEVLPVTTHAYLINFVGIMTMFLSALLLKEKPTPLQVSGAIIAILGVHIYFDVFPSGKELYGVLLLVAAVFFLAMTNILMRLLHIKHAQVLPYNLVSTIAIVAGGLPLVIYGLQFTPRLVHIAWFDWFVIAANGMIAMSLVMNVFNIVMRHLKAFEASILASTGLIFTALISIPVLNESLSLGQMLGILLLLAGISCVQIKQIQKR